MIEAEGRRATYICTYYWNRMGNGCWKLIIIIMRMVMMIIIIIIIHKIEIQYIQKKGGRPSTKEISPSSTKEQLGS